MNNRFKTDRNNSDLVNYSIKFNQVMVIGPEGEQLGIMSRFKAFEAADSYDLDILCVAPNGKPPVCKILNYSKYRYEVQKKAKEAKKNQKIIDIKEVQLSPMIGEHDLLTKVANANKFLARGDKVKVVLRFRGRQVTHLEVGEQVMSHFTELVSENGIVEKQPFLEGKLMTAVIASKFKK